MRKTPSRVATPLLAIALWMPLAASAQGTPPPPVKTDGPILFIDMEEMLLSGRIARPTLTRVDARQRARFERLLRLRHDVVGALRDTARDAALR